MMPVTGCAEWRMALTMPSRRRAQTSSGGRESHGAEVVIAVDLGFLAFDVGSYVAPT